MNSENIKYAGLHTADCYGDGTVYRGQRSKDSVTKTVTGTLNEFSGGRGNGTPLYAAPVDTKAIRECRNPKADEVRAYRDKHSVSMKQAYEKVKLELNAKAEKAGIKFTGGFVRVAEFVTEDELLELSKAIRAEALEEADRAVYEAYDKSGSPDAWVCVEAVRGLK